MSGPRLGTSDDARMNGEVEHEHLDDPAGNRLPETGRRALVSLLMNRYVSRARHRAAWEGIVTYEHDLRDRLDELYLDLIVDHEAEVAFKRQQDGDDVPRMLRREKALTRDASFVLIFLRREYAFADPDDGPVMITRDQIAEKLWGNHVFVDVEQGINTAIRKVRKALNDDSAQPQLLQTVVGRGYRFVGFTEEHEPSENVIFSAEELGRAIRAAAGLHEDEKKVH